MCKYERDVLWKKKKISGGGGEFDQQTHSSKLDRKERFLDANFHNNFLFSTYICYFNLKF